MKQMKNNQNIKNLFFKIIGNNQRLFFQTYKQVRKIDFGDVEAIPHDFSSDSLQSLKISLCTTCMNRAHHIKFTLLKNIQDNQKYQKFEVVLLNYNSGDDLDRWARKKLDKFVKSGQVIYAKTHDPSSFNPSHAKNLAHCLATGDILVNVDADQFVGEGFCKFINDFFKSIPNRFSLQFLGALSTSGRIAVSRKDFFEIKGYNEELTSNQFGYEDYDFLCRLEESGVPRKNVSIKNFTKFIWHSDEERTRNFAKSQISVVDTANANFLISDQNIKNGRLLGNYRPWAVANLEVGFLGEQIKMQMI